MRSFLPVRCRKSSTCVLLPTANPKLADYVSAWDALREFRRYARSSLRGTQLWQAVTFARDCSVMQSRWCEPCRAGQAKRRAAS